MPARWGKGKGEVLRGEKPEFPEPGDFFPDRKVRHGTTGGWRQHQMDGEEPCESCRQAKSAYDYRWQSGSEQTKRNRIGAKAQNRANTALRARYPAEYRDLYEKFRADLLKEAGLEVTPPRRKYPEEFPPESRT